VARLLPEDGFGTEHPKQALPRELARFGVGSAVKETRHRGERALGELDRAPSAAQELERSRRAHATLRSELGHRAPLPEPVEESTQSRRPAHDGRRRGNRLGRARCDPGAGNERRLCSR